jgi:hypothetical protein
VRRLPAESQCCSHSTLTLRMDEVPSFCEESMLGCMCDAGYRRGCLDIGFGVHEKPARGANQRADELGLLPYTCMSSVSR